VKFETNMTQLNKDISPVAYATFLSDVANAVQQHRIEAVQAVQTISNQLYWNIGELIIKKQEEFGWGKSVILMLSQDLPQLIGEGVSWSPRNLQFMKQLVTEYSNMKSAVSYLEGSKSENLNVNQLDSHFENLKKLVFSVPWQHNVLILQKIKDPKARVFYLQQTIKNRYSRAVLLHQIKANAYEHYVSKPSQHNFGTVLPEHFQEQARESIKSVYSLDFLDINKPVSERELENSMVEKVKRLMLELGYGFCFIGNQYRLSLGDKDYYIDLLFYHRILKCLVAVELKVVEFEPEFVGKLDFYLQLMDEQLKQFDDQPSIGILLVPDKNHLEVEYALRNANKPIGVAEYYLSKQLPQELVGKLPTSEQFQNLWISEIKPKDKKTKNE
jgi:predicted nuclease of restriction endonuclease-like (RecB) superfamily